MVNKFKLVSLAVSSLFTLNVQANSDTAYFSSVAFNSLLASDYFKESSIETFTNKDYVKLSSNKPNVYWDKIDRPLITASPGGLVSIDEPTNWLPSTFTSTYPNNVWQWNKYYWQPTIGAFGNANLVFQNRRSFNLSSFLENGKSTVGKSLSFVEYGAFVYLNRLEQRNNTYPAVESVVPTIEYMSLDEDYKMSSGVPILDSNFYVYALVKVITNFRNYDTDINKPVNFVYCDYSLCFYGVEHRYSLQNLSMPFTDVYSFALVADTPNHNYEPEPLLFEVNNSKTKVDSFNIVSSHNNGTLLCPVSPVSKRYLYRNEIPSTNSYNYVENMNIYTQETSFKFKPLSYYDDAPINVDILYFPSVYKIDSSSLGYQTPIYPSVKYGDGAFMIFRYAHRSSYDYPYSYLKGLYEFGMAQNDTYQLGFSNGYDYAMDKVNYEGSNYAQSFSFINNAMQGIKTLLSTEVFPGINISLFIFLPLMLGVVCLLLKFLH